MPLPRPIRILHVEDNPRDAEIIRHKLEVEGVSCDIVLAGSREAFDAALSRETFDLVLCDDNLLNYNGTLRRANEIRPEAPVIIMSGTVGEAEAVQCLHSGATDVS